MTVPPLSDTASQLPPLNVDAVAVKPMEPPPWFETVSCVVAGVAPVVSAKDKLGALTASLPGEHPAAERSLSPADAVSAAPAGRTTNVTFAVRMVWLENDTDTSPVYTPGFKLAWFTLTEIWPASGVDAAPPGL